MKGDGGEGGEGGMLGEPFLSLKWHMYKYKYRMNINTIFVCMMYGKALCITHINKMYQWTRADK